MQSIARVAKRHASYSATGRKFFVGGNWKANGSHAQVQQWLATLNSGKVAATTEVVVAPPFPYLSEVKSALRKDFAVAAQVR
jgi:triosephosphate isomerase